MRARAKKKIINLSLYYQVTFDNDSITFPFVNSQLVYILSSAHSCDHYTFEMISIHVELNMLCTAKAV